jgi:hypothetical protein
VTLEPQAGQHADPLRESGRAAHLKASRIVMAMAASIPIYTAVGLLVARSLDDQAASRRPLMPFIVAVIFLALGSTVLRRTQLRWLRLQAVAGLRGVEGLINHLTRTTIMSAALAEAIGLLALVISFLSGDQYYVLIFGVVGFVVAIASYPRRAAWERTVEHFASKAAT